ncbi:MAG: glycosyl hydrolase [Saprospiraceae bacterium]|uniref:Glycosyl hydrolase n=1 Tax=Candidatus Opimibacter skivensis TaxID=2982028 RepID=A0A9D7XP23_9BACT|nr:glycosyl hydrolase [Candidatus Opimibacter skivensis]
MKFKIILPLLLVILSITTIYGQRKKIIPPTFTPVDSSLFRGLEWRNIGPFRGGRSAAVTGVRGKPSLYYFGSTGGGVWRTKDGGQSWENISDGFFGGSIGAIEVAPSDANVIYVGGGEETVRGNVSSGSGMWRSTDAGQTWQHIGLENSKQIPRVRVDPHNPDIVYAAVLGDLYKDTKERGIYKSVDGGKTWRQTLFVNERAGAVDLIIDPNNSRILYASTWRVHRSPYELSSGGEGSSLWKSKDSGETWQNISSASGLPKGTWGISGITVSPVNSNRLWAIIENEDGGVFRSDDSGKTWTKTNSDRNLRQRAWYYSRIYADPSSEGVVYVVNVSYHKSSDGGNSFSSYGASHGDHHDLWIDPDNPQRMIIGDDGGAQVSYDGGENWSTYHNQPTAQIYRVTTDNHFPYRIYGAQQDNSTVRISSRTGGGTIGEDDWESTAGCESGWIAVDPLNDDVVYGGCYDGVIDRLDHKTGFSRNVDVWPDLPMGHGAEGSKYRFQWNFPIYFSPHDPKKLYAASNYLHVTTDEGQSWKTISPDLTRNDTAKLKPSGGPITKDNTSVEYYCTIFTIAESPRVKDLLWVGSDDGLIHVTKDGGKSWQDVTPAFLPKWIMINSIEPDPHLDGGCYVAATMYKSGDYKPYLLRTKDYGQTWQLITTGIDSNHFTRVIRSDPNSKGILYAGTEAGIYISFDDGDHWQTLQLNLPIVPVTDLTIKNNNLIAATQGRSFWILDDLNQLRQLKPTTPKELTVYQPEDFYRMTGYSGKSTVEGTNYAGGLNVYYFLPDSLKKDDTLAITVFTSAGDTIVSYSSAPKEKNEKLTPKKGMNKFNWNLQYKPAVGFEGMILWGGGLSGPRAVPGSYAVEFNYNHKLIRKSFTILQDPRSKATTQHYTLYHEFVMEVSKKMTEANKTIIIIRDIRQQLKNYMERVPKEDELKKEIGKIDSVMTKIEEALYQTKNKSGQDPLNYPVRLTDKLAYLKSIMGSGEYPPTEQAYDVRKELEAEIDVQLALFEKVKNEMIPVFNQMIRDKHIDAIILKKG